MRSPSHKCKILCTKFDKKEDKCILVRKGNLFAHIKMVRTLLTIIHESIKHYKVNQLFNYMHY